MQFSSEPHSGLLEVVVNKSRLLTLTSSHISSSVVAPIPVRPSAEIPPSITPNAVSLSQARLRLRRLIDGLSQALRFHPFDHSDGSKF